MKQVQNGELIKQTEIDQATFEKMMREWALKFYFKVEPYLKNGVLQPESPSLRILYLVIVIYFQKNNLLNATNQ